MSVLDNILDLGVKYGPEVAQYFSGQKRIRQAIEDQRREELPEFGRRSATAAEQTLSNLANRDLFAGQKEEARRQFQGALGTAGRTKGGQGLRTLPQLLGASGRVQQQLADAEVAQRRASAQAAAPFERAIQDYNMGVSDQRKLYDFMKEREINSLEDQAQRMRGRGARTLFDILGDSRGLFAKPLAENPAPERMEQIESLPATQNPVLEKTLLGSPKSLDMSALQKAREYGDNLTAGDELMDLLNVDVSAPEDMKSLPRKDGPLGSGVRRRPATAKSIVSLLRDQVGPRRVDLEGEPDLVRYGGPGSFDFSNPNVRALFNLLRK